MRFRLLKIVTWLVIVTVLCVAIGVALLRVLVFTGGEKGHSSSITDKAIVIVQAESDNRAQTKGRHCLHHSQ